MGSNHPNRGRGENLYKNPPPRRIRAVREGAGLTSEQAAELVLATGAQWEAWERIKGGKRMHPGLWRLFLIEISVRRCQPCVARSLRSTELMDRHNLALRHTKL